MLQYFINSDFNSVLGASFYKSLLVVSPCSLPPWTSTISVWLRMEKACGEAGEKAAVEEVALNQQVENKVNLLSLLNFGFEGIFQILPQIYLFLLLLVQTLDAQQPAPSTDSQHCSSLAPCHHQQTLIAEFLRGNKKFPIALLRFSSWLLFYLEPLLWSPLNIQSF